MAPKKPEAVKKVRTKYFPPSSTKQQRIYGGIYCAGGPKKYEKMSTYLAKKLISRIDSNKKCLILQKIYVELEKTTKTHLLTKDTRSFHSDKFEYFVNYHMEKFKETIEESFQRYREYLHEMRFSKKTLSKQAFEKVCTDNNVMRKILMEDFRRLLENPNSKEANYLLSDAPLSDEQIGFFGKILDGINEFIYCTQKLQHEGCYEMSMYYNTKLYTICRLLGDLFGEINFRIIILSNNLPAKDNYYLTIGLEQKTNENKKVNSSKNSSPAQPKTANSPRTSPPPNTVTGTSPPPNTVTGTSTPPNTVTGTSPPPNPVTGTSSPPNPVTGTSPPPNPVTGTSSPPNPVTGTSPPPNPVKETSSRPGSNDESKLGELGEHKAEEIVVMTIEENLRKEESPVPDYPRYCTRGYLARGRVARSQTSKH